MSDSTTGTDTQLQAIEKDLAGISEGLARSASTTKKVGLVLMGLMLAYFVWGYTFINELFNPDKIVPLAGVTLENHLPGLRQTLQTSLADQAPIWAEGLSTSAIEAAPSAREQLEDYALKETTSTVEKVVAVGEREFRTILRENRTSFEETITKLSSDEDYTDETLAIFQAAVNDQLGQDMQAQALEVLGTLISLREKLQKLAAGETMNKEEATERHALTMIRHLQLREADESFEERIKRRDAQLTRESDGEESGEGTEPEEGDQPALEGDETPDSDKPESDTAPAEADADSTAAESDDDDS